MAFGLLYDTAGCDDYMACLAEATNAVSAEADDPTARRPAALEVFRAFAAKAYLIESEYFDADFRSEFSVVNLTSFASISPEVYRVHFFDAAPLNPIDGDYQPLQDFVRDNQSVYRGYTIIRPQEPASIGRSIIGLPHGSGHLQKTVSLAKRVRTPVIENVTLFGVSLRAIGVPFMEQDWVLLRCAHVVAWMAHFTAVLNGNVARRASGSFNDIEGPVRLLGRAYPSPDLSSWSLTHMLSRANLPPEVVTGYRLQSTREFFWFDNPKFKAHLAEDAKKLDGDDLVNEAWIANNLTGTICRYLNSGIPCIYNFPGHSIMICGYFRERDLPGGKRDDSSVAGFLVMDDQAGPYQVVTVKEIVSNVLEDEGDVSIVIPLPAGLWLSGEAAELAGAKAFAKMIDSVTMPEDTIDELALDVPKTVVTHLVPELTDAYTALRAQTQGKEPCEYAIRSYAVQGSDFKVDFGERLQHDESRRIIGYTTLPKYVWVVEVLARKLHRQGRKAAVVATIVLDGSASNDDKMRPPSPLLFHIPGLIRRATDPGWHRSRDTPYRSGRWAHGGLTSQVKRDARANHFKWAM